MENIDIPDDFRIIDTEYGKYLCHKSCLWSGCSFSNYRNVYFSDKLDNNDIDKLRFICNVYDKIEDITHFVDGKFNKFFIYVISVHTYGIEIYNNKYHDFGSLDEALQYLRENHPECIKGGDIKIALK